MSPILLLRWSQTGLILCGLLLIATGSGVQLPWLSALIPLALTGAIAGVIHEGQLWRRGESQEWLPLLLPVVGGFSGAFAWLSNC